jgi:hypothetical protein
MLSHTVSRVGDPTPDERRRQLAAILAQGVIRHRRIAELAEVGQVSLTRDTGLEFVSEMRLSVTVGLADVPRGPESEVNDGRSAWKLPCRDPSPRTDSRSAACRTGGDLEAASRR